MSANATEAHPTTAAEKEMTLVGHLAELRTRIVRILIYTIVGTGASWMFYEQSFSFLSSPIMQFLNENGSKFLLTGIAEGFAIKIQICLLMGIVFALPLITIEGWMFIVPGLSKQERRAVYLVAPLSVILFGLGIVMAYKVLPMGIRWLVSQNPPEAAFMPSVQQTILFILKMYLAFGILFQLPVVIMFLTKIGLVNSSMLKSYWRQAIVIMGIVAALVTPSGDAFTMILMTVPLIILYAMSIGLAKLIERKSA